MPLIMWIVGTVLGCLAGTVHRVLGMRGGCQGNASKTSTAAGRLLRYEVICVWLDITSLVNSCIVAPACRTAQNAKASQGSQKSQGNSGYSSHALRVGSGCSKLPNLPRQHELDGCLYPCLLPSL